MSDEKQGSDGKDEVQIGTAKIPTSTILAVVAAILTGIGSIAAQHTGNGDLKNDVAVMKNDIQWIKWRLNEDARLQTEPRKAPSKPASPVPPASSQSYPSDSGL